MIQNSPLSPNAPIGLVAGRGNLPLLILEACRQAGRRVSILAHHGQTPRETAEKADHIWLSLGQVGHAFDFLKSQGLSDIVMAGAFSRPSLRDLKTDWTGMKLLPRFLALRSQGDAALLDLLRDILTERGLRIHAPQNLLKTLIRAPGSYSSRTPTDKEKEAIDKGFEALKTLSLLDVGQALVMQGPRLLGIEGAEGTDNLIRRCKDLALSGPLRPLLVKAAKVGQDLRLDPPVLGPDTLACARDADFSGLAFHAPTTLVLDAKKMRRMADESNLLIWGSP